MTEATRLPFPEPLHPGVFLARPNRFLCRVLLAGPPGSPLGDPVEAHLPDPGRLRELLVPGRRLLLAPASNPHRRTRWTVVLVQTEKGDGWVSVDTTLPNRLLAHHFAAAEARGEDPFSELPGWRLGRAEVVRGASRFDFVLVRGGSGEVEGEAPGKAGASGDAGGAGAPEAPVEEGAMKQEGAARETGQGGPQGEPRPDELVLEAKSVTLVEEGVALFPDAVTARGTRHVREMTELARKGHPAAVIFVAQRADVEAIEAAWAIDPDFSEALEEAREAGVLVFGRRCEITPEGVTLLGAVPVLRSHS